MPVRSFVLLGVEHDCTIAVGKHVEPRPAGEIISVLTATVQRYEKWGAAAVSFRYVQPVVHGCLESANARKNVVKSDGVKPEHEGR